MKHIKTNMQVLSLKVICLFLTALLTTMAHFERETGTQPDGKKCTALIYSIHFVCCCIIESREKNHYRFRGLSSLISLSTYQLWLTWILLNLSKTNVSVEHEY